MVAGGQRCGEMALRGRCSECQGCQPPASQQWLLRRSLAASSLAQRGRSIFRFVIIIRAWDRVFSVSLHRLICSLTWTALISTAHPCPPDCDLSLVFTFLSWRYQPAGSLC